MHHRVTFLLFIYFFALTKCQSQIYNYNVILTESAADQPAVQRTVEVVAGISATSENLCYINVTFTNSDKVTFYVHVGNVENSVVGNLPHGETIIVNVTRGTWSLSLFELSCYDPPIVSSLGCSFDANMDECYDLTTSVAFDRSYLESVYARRNQTTDCVTPNTTTACDGYPQWWYQPNGGATTLLSTLPTTTLTTKTTSPSSTTQSTSTTRTQPTTSPSSNLQDLANQGVGLNNISQILNITYTYAQMGPALNSSDIMDITTILNNSASVKGISTDNSVQILWNIDCVMNANEDQLKNSTEHLLNIFGKMVHNTNGSRVEYLDGMNLGFSSKRINCRKLGVDDGLIDMGNGFEPINSTTNIQSTERNGLIIPLSDLCKTTRLTHIFFTIYRDRKLFAGRRQHRTFGQRKRSIYTPGDDEQIDPDIEVPSRCIPQIALTSDVPVMSASVMNNGVLVSTASTDNGIMANLQFNIENIPNPLHGKFQVTWWNTSSNQWASDQYCTITQRTDKLILAQCPHLTDFTVIVDGTLDDQIVCNKALAVTGYVANSISVLSLIFLTMITVMVFIPNKSVRSFLLIIRGQDTNGDVILLAYYTSLLLFYVLFLSFAVDSFSQVGCTITAILMYFLLLCSIMLNIIQGIRIIHTFFPPKIFKFFSIILSPPAALTISFGIPAILCTLLATLNTSFFERNDSFCWIRPDYIITAIVVPVTILLLNAVVCTSFVIYKMFFFAKRASRKELTFYDAEFWSKIMSIFIMEISLGAPWIIQYFTLAWPDTTFWNFLFTIVLGSQGTILLLIFLYRRQKLYRQASINSTKFSKVSK